MRTAIQLYTLREIDEPLPAILERVADAGYDGVEFAYRLHDADLDAVLDTLDDTGLDVAGAHVGTDRFEEFEEIADSYHAVGCETVIVPAVDQEQFSSVIGVGTIARQLRKYARTATDHGFEFAYHNHDFEFGQLGEESAYENMVAQLNHQVGLEIDVGWVHAGGFDPAELIERYSDRTTHLHVTDVVGDEPAEVGEGETDIEACVDAAHDADVEWLVYEHDIPEAPLDSLEHGATELNRLAA